MPNSTEGANPETPENHTGTNSSNESPEIPVDATGDASVAAAAANYYTKFKIITNH